MKKIGIVVACENEIVTILKGELVAKKIYLDLPYKTYLYEFDNKLLYVSLSGIGEMASSACTQFLITKFGVESIFNFGACGSLSSDLGLVDVVFIDYIIDLSFDTSPIDNCDKFTHIELGFNTPLMKLDNKLTNLAKEIYPSIKNVICASNNIFVANKEEKEAINHMFNASICEMESAGIYLTCLKNNIPCFLVKSVSDSLLAANEDYQKFATNAAKKALDIMLKIIKNI